MNGLEPPFTIRFTRSPWWTSDLDRYEIVDMNGLCVAMHYSDCIANHLCVEWNQRFGTASGTARESWQQ